MIIPEDKITEIREAIDIVDFISGYVSLKKKGRNFFGLCPFHQEKTPSFSVNPEKQIFHCFGCSAGGNVYTFLMRNEGLSFPEAVKFLAQKAGIALELSDEDPTERKESEALYFVNDFAADIYNKNLLKETGKKALDYLLGRGISKEDIETYTIGYAPPEWDSLLKSASRASFETEQLVKAGLVLQKESDRTYDRFRDRIIFTVKNLSGRVIAFGGRRLSDDVNSPKYINSPETAVYQKGKQLYGLFETRNSIRQEERAVFVEGYMDFLSLVSNGIPNVVATLGTALTEDQAALILRYTKNVVLMYDSDAAGIKATMRAADILLKTGINVKIVLLPDKHDPDSFIRSEGVEKLRDKISSAVDVIDFKLGILERVAPEKRSDEIHSVLESLSLVKDRIQRNLLLSKTASRLKMSEGILWKELEAIQFRQKQRSRRTSGIGQHIQDIGLTGKRSRSEKAVEDLIRILVHDWSQADFIFENISQDAFMDSDYADLMKFLYNQYRGGGQPELQSLLHRFSDIKTTEFLVSVISQDETMTGSPDGSSQETIDFSRWSHDCVAVIRRELLQKRIDDLREKMRLSPDQQETKNFLIEIQKLESEKIGLSLSRN